MKTQKIENFIINFFSDKNEKKIMVVKWTAVIALLAAMILANLLR